MMPAGAAKHIGSVICLTAVSLAASVSRGPDVPLCPLRPHLVLAVVDDLGWNGLPWTEGNAEVYAPETSLLAKEGVVLTNYRVFKFCAPSRASLLTGRVPGHGVFTKNPPVDAPVGLNRCMQLLPAVLGTVGYRTALVGKWHLGFARPSFAPPARGFDSSFGYLGGAEDHFTQCAGCANRIPADWTAAAFACPSQLSVCGVECPTRGDVDLHRDGKPAVGENGTAHSSELLAREAVRVIEAHAAGAASAGGGPAAMPCVGRRVRRWVPPARGNGSFRAGGGVEPLLPLFLYLALQDVHLPLEPSPAYLARYDPAMYPGHAAARRAYNAMHTAADSAIGSVVAALRRTRMWERTVLVVTTDNGGTWEHGGLVPGSSNWPLRGAKYSYFDGGVRGAAFVASPLLPPAARGHRCDALLHVSDWYPTLLGLAGAHGSLGSDAFVDKAPVDGIDSWPLISSTCARDEGVGTVPLRPPSVWAAQGGPGAGEVVLGIEPGGRGAFINGSHKLVVGAQSLEADGWSARLPGTTPSEPPPREAFGGGACSDRPCIFDLQADPRERKDLADAEPALAAALRARFDALRHKMDVADPDAELDSGPASRDGCAKMLQTGFWQPWLPDDTVKCRQPTPTTDAGDAVDTSRHRA